MLIPSAITALATVTVAAQASHAGGTTQAKHKPKITVTRPCNTRHYKEAVAFYRTLTWRWQSQHDASHVRTLYHERRTASCKYTRWLAFLWRDRASEARKQFLFWYRVKLVKWDCIHRHEAGWHGDDNAIYDGGLQMDSEFQSTYGYEFMRRWGQASNWPVWAQLLAAERAYKTRGFGPWPTRQYCGL